MRHFTIALTFSIAACGPKLDDFEPLEPAMQNTTTEDGGTVLQFTVTPADILFVVDSSGSMADEQLKLASNFHRFLSQIADHVDHRIAVVSTDTFRGSVNTGRVSFQWQTTAPWVVQEIDYSMCMESQLPAGCAFGPDPGRRVVDSSMSYADEVTAFANNVNVGTCGSGNESGFEALLLALDQMGPGGCNEGFLRGDDVNLVVIFVSDEDDSSDLPVDEVADRLAMYKPYERIRVATIVGAVGGDASACRIGGGGACGDTVCNGPRPVSSNAPCTASNVSACQAGELCVSGYCRNQAEDFFDAGYCHWCSYFAAPDCCAALPSSRYVDFARLIEARVSNRDPDITASQCRGTGTKVACLVESICQESFGDSMARIARELVLLSN